MANHPIAVSLKARGLSVLEKSFAVGFKEFWPQAGAETLDLGVSIAINVVLLTWSTWFSVILTILSLCFYAFFQNGQVATDGSPMVPVAFLIYLPTLWLAHMANQRRYEAARHLESVQSHVTGMYVLHGGLSGCGAPELLSQLDDTISDTIGQLQGYLAHPRPLSSHHFSPSCLRAEHLPVKSRLFVLGRDIGQRLRRLHSCQRRLSAVAAALLEHCSSSRYPQQQQHTQLVLTLVQQLVSLNQSIAALTTIKDLRSPLLLRVMLRAGCVLLAPLLTGSWLARLAYEATPPGKQAGAVGMVFGIVVGAILQVLLMSLLTLALLLEDPFDTAASGSLAAPDTISLLEFNHTLNYLTAPPNAEDDPPIDESQQVDGQLQQQQTQAKYQQQVAGFVSAQQQQQLRQDPGLQPPASYQQQLAPEQQQLQQADIERPVSAAAVSANGSAYQLETASSSGVEHQAMPGSDARGWGYHNAAALGRYPSAGAETGQAGASAGPAAAGGLMRGQGQPQATRTRQRASPAGSPVAGAPAAGYVSRGAAQQYPRQPNSAVAGAGEVDVNIAEA